MRSSRTAAVWASLVLSALVAFALTGCQNSTAPGSEKTFSSTLVNAHTHDVTITQAEVSSPPASGVSMMTSSSSGHTHSFAMTQSQLMDVSSDIEVTVTTGPSDVTGTHTHNFLVILWF